MSRATSPEKTRPAEVVREYGPFPEVDHVRGVTFDGASVWFAAGDHLQAFDPETGDVGKTLPVSARAGTAFDGQHLYQVSGDVIQKLDPSSGAVLGTLAVPPGEGHAAGLTWAEGTLWLARHEARRIQQLDPITGRVLRTLDSPRFVTGVTFTDGELWHGTWEDDDSDLRRIDPTTGELLECLTMPTGAVVTGLECDGGSLFYCGGGASGKVRAVRRPRGLPSDRS